MLHKTVQGPQVFRARGSANCLSFKIAAFIAGSYSFIYNIVHVVTDLRNRDYELLKNLLI